jgi:hypothetical protein
MAPRLLLVLLVTLHAIFLYAQPANDNPCGAITIPVYESVDIVSPVNYSISGATATVTITNNCANNPDVWYTFIPPTDVVYIKMNSGIYFVLYEENSCAGSFNDPRWECVTSAVVTDGEFVTGVNQGQRYYIRITNINNNPAFNFGLVVQTKTFADGQRVGINTKFPTTQFDVVGNARFRNYAIFESGISIKNFSEANNRVLTSDANGYASWRDLGSLPGGWNVNGNNIFNSNLGNVGIGINSPDAPLSFANSTGKKISFSSSGASNQFGMGVQSNLLQIYGDAAGSDIAFGYGTSTSFIERMRIRGNGNVGIGVTNPSAPLSFPASLGKKISLYPGGTGDVGMSVQGNDFRLYTDNVFAKVSIGYSQYAGDFYQNNLDVFANGNATLRGILTQNSDIRLKRNITPLENSLNLLSQLNGYHYYWKSTTNDQSIQTGLIAQEVQKLFPELVKENEKGELSVNYSGLIPVMIESLKEQKKQSDERFNQQEEKIKSLEAQLNQIMKMIKAK